ncbi:MAG: 2-C-methyl-D-erythritol 4-phosphate cytidylyltransferase [Thermosynechococcaceae cyanobacterium MS004]|nr:2-C-methyl-D-erythritol 4-phosphate cytidylyltransferase [Thermosynechococcaceae cyanobacterium MS004]
MHLLIPAAGMGKRMGSSHNKLRLSLLEKPILAWTLLAAEAATSIHWIGLIGQPEDREIWEALLQDLQLSKPVEMIVGGATRQESVYNGLQALPTDAAHVLIHDGARCLVTPALIDRCAAALNEYLGFVAAVPVKDTIKVVDANRQICATPDRAQLWAAQTPQGFDVEKLKACHAEGQRQGWEVTDDAALFERFNLPVHIVMGEETNLKVTTPADLAIAALILQQRFP